MNVLLDHPMVERIGWTLLHSLWQGAAAAGVLACALLVLRPSAARARYAAACAALLVMAGAMAATFVMLRPAVVNVDALSANVVRVASEVGTVREDAEPRFALGSIAGVEARVRSALPWVVIAWGAGVVTLCMYNVGGWVMLRRLRRGATPLGEPWEGILRRWMHRLDVAGPVRIAQSVRVQVPTVIGWLRPLILVPAAAIGGLSPMQIECILAHELAHIRRRDYLLNLLQVALETVLFYHPAVWWIGRVIRREREHCCDDIAAAAVGNRVAYAEALTKMEELRATPLALALQGTALLPRIRRLLDLPPQRTHAPAVSLSLAAILVALLAIPLLTPQRGALATEPPVADVPSMEPIDDVAPSPPKSSSANLEERERLQEELRKTQARVKELEMFHGPNHRVVVLERQRLAYLQHALNRALRPAHLFYYVSGVARSGTYQMQPDETLTLKAALVAGGVDGIDEKHVILRRKTAAADDTRVFELRHVLEGKQGEELVRPGDVLMVTRNPQAVQAPPERIFIGGELPRPGTYQLAGSMTLLQALISAGANPPDDRQDLPIAVSRGGKVTHLTVYELLNVPEKNVSLEAGDEIRYGVTESPAAKEGVE